jgi:hypothetical protein
MFKYAKPLIDNLKYVPDGIIEILTSIENSFSGITNSTIFKILYFIPICILKLISLIPKVYYEHIMTNEEFLKISATHRVVFVYLIPIAAVCGLFWLLSKSGGEGFEILCISAAVLALFPVFVILMMFTSPTMIEDFIKNRDINAISRKISRIRDRETRSIRYIKDAKTRQAKIYELALKYALGRIKGYKKVLTNLNIPSKNKYTKINGILINKKGIFVWNSKVVKDNSFYGGRYDDHWYVGSYMYPIDIAVEKYKNGDRAILPPIRINNPLKENRTKINALQKILKANGWPNIHIFSGVSVPYLLHDTSKIEYGPDEAFCSMSYVPSEIRRLSKMSKSNLTKKEINGIAKILSSYQETSKKDKKSYIEKPESNRVAANKALVTSEPNQTLIVYPATKG